MASTGAMQWELYGAGSAVVFTALRDESGFGIQLRRDDALLVSDVAPDLSTLLRKSNDLRDHLVRLGFATECPFGDAGRPDGGEDEPLALFETTMLRALRHDLLLPPRS
jgi:hypothetical protein